MFHWIFLFVIVLLLTVCTSCASQPPKQSDSSGLIVSDIKEKSRHQERIHESILALGEADLMDASLSPEQRKINTILRSLLRLPEEELSYLPLSLTPETKILEHTPEADILLQAWAERQITLQEALKHMVQPAESMTQLIQALREQDIPAFLAIHDTVHSTDGSINTSVNDEQRSQFNSQLSVVKEKFAALEEFLSDVDNARDFHTLELWPNLLSFLHRSYPPVIRAQAAWVTGSAIQGVFAYNHLQGERGANHNVGNEDIEENHRWLFEKFNVSISRKNFMDDVVIGTEGNGALLEGDNDASTLSLSSSGLELVLEMLVDFDVAKKLSKSFDPDFLKKTLYAFSAALRGSIETQSAVSDMINSNYGDLPNILYRIAVPGNSLPPIIREDDNSIETIASLEGMRRMWALSADLGHELTFVVQEYYNLFDGLKEAATQWQLATQRESAMKNESDHSENNSFSHSSGHQGDRTSDEWQNVVQQKQQTLRQAVGAMRDTEFLYPQLLSPRNNNQYWDSAVSLLSQSFNHQTDMLRTVSQQPQSLNSVQKRDYVQFRALSRELMRYVASHVNLYLYTQKCDMFTRNFSLWDHWFGASVGFVKEIEKFKRDIRMIVSLAKDTLQAESSVIAKESDQEDFKLWDLGFDEEVIELVAKCELSLDSL